MTGDNLERRFDRAMADVYERAKREVGYNATRYLQLLSEHGGLATARLLLTTPNVSDGFTTLWEAHRLDLTVEAHVLKPEFRGLFTAGELAVARERLDALGYSMPAEPEHR